MIKRLLSIILILLLPVFPTYAAEEPREVYNIVTTFFEDAKTTRAFAWTADAKFRDMAIRYGPVGEDWESYREVNASLHGSNITEKGQNIHHFKVALKDLLPGTDYAYHIGSPEHNFWTQSYIFTTEPEQAEGFSFVAVTDMQGLTKPHYNIFSNVIETAMNDCPDAGFFVSLGDQVENNDNLEQWEWYFGSFGGRSASLPVMALVGNHEAMHTAKSDAGYNYLMHFYNPQNGGRKALKNLEPIREFSYKTDDMVGLLNNINGSFYSFDYGDAHFTVLNSGSASFTDVCALPLLNAQKEWLKADLKASDAKWKIVLVHQGLYPAQRWRYFGSREVLEDVIDSCGVDLVLQGHDHMFMRTYPMRNGSVANSDTPERVKKGEGTVYYIPGASGYESQRNFFENPDYVAKSAETPKAVYATVSVDERSLSVTTKNVDGDLVDSFKIVDESLPLPNPFVDVSENDWFYPAVFFAYENGITGGISSKEFAPFGQVTRAEFITMLCRAYGIEERSGDNFFDCGTTWYTGYLAAAKQLGISNGIGDNRFAPNVPITREQMLTLIYNYLNPKNQMIEEEIIATTFADDADISAWAKPAVAYGQRYQFISGKDGNRFAPKDTATRAELVQILMNVLS